MEWDETKKKVIYLNFILILQDLVNVNDMSLAKEQKNSKVVKENRKKNGGSRDIVE